MYIQCCIVSLYNIIKDDLMFLKDFDFLLRKVKQTYQEFILS